MSKMMETAMKLWVAARHVQARVVCLSWKCAGAGHSEISVDKSVNARIARIARLLYVALDSWLWICSYMGMGQN